MSFSFNKETCRLVKRTPRGQSPGIALGKEMVVKDIYIYIYMLQFMPYKLLIALDH